MQPLPQLLNGPPAPSANAEKQGADAPGLAETFAALVPATKAPAALPATSPPTEQTAPGRAGEPLVPARPVKALTAPAVSGTGPAAAPLPSPRPVVSRDAGEAVPSPGRQPSGQGAPEPLTDGRSPVAVAPGDQPSSVAGKTSDASSASAVIRLPQGAERPVHNEQASPSAGPHAATSPTAQNGSKPAPAASPGIDANPGAVVRSRDSGTTSAQAREPAAPLTADAPVTASAETPTSERPNVRPTTDAAAAQTAARTAPSHEPAALGQVRAAIEARGPSRQIEVRLDPPELGRVQIDLELGRSGRVRAVITAAEPETLDILRRNAASLTQDLEQGGFTDVELDWRGSESDPGPQDRRQTFPGGPAPAPATTAAGPAALRHDGTIDLSL